jgi:hypothetical protein
MSREINTLTASTKKFSGWNNPDLCLILLAMVMAIAFSVWTSLLNNFTIEQANFTGVEIGFLHSFREIPGLLAFTVIFLLAFINEQRMALLSLCLMGAAAAITGFFPTAIGLYCTTVAMSIGFHYYEAMQMSLTLQWISKEKAPESLGRQVAAKSMASLFTFALVWICLEVFQLSYTPIYLIGGGIALVLALFVWVSFPMFKEVHEQHKKIILRKRYWLFYALTFMSGARRQIFVVFAGFLMVEKFGLDAAAVTSLFLVNHVFSLYFAAKIGRLIHKWGERKALIVEYIGLIFVFIGYGLADETWMGASLYVIDHLFFAMAIAQKSYLQKIADPKDIAATSSVSFSINHIAAVFIPALFGFIWIEDNSLVFFIGAGMAAVSLILSFNIPNHPEPGNETRFGHFSNGVKQAVQAK